MPSSTASSSSFESLTEQNEQKADVFRKPSEPTTPVEIASTPLKTPATAIKAPKTPIGNADQSLSYTPFGSPPPQLLAPSPRAPTPLKITRVLEFDTPIANSSRSRIPLPPLGKLVDIETPQPKSRQATEELESPANLIDALSPDRPIIYDLKVPKPDGTWAYMRVNTVATTQQLEELVRAKARELGTRSDDPRVEQAVEGISDYLGNSIAKSGDYTDEQLASMRDLKDGEYVLVDPYSVSGLMPGGYIIEAGEEDELTVDVVRPVVRMVLGVYNGIHWMYRALGSGALHAGHLKLVREAVGRGIRERLEEERRTWESGGGKDGEDD